MNRIRVSHPPSVYCDMDGVLVNFYAGMMRHYPAYTTPNAIDRFLRRPGTWDKILQEHPHFFRELPKLPDADVLMSALLQLRDTGRIRLYMLTACPRELTHDSVSEDKRDWMHQYYPRIPREHIYVVFRKQKQNYAQSDVNRPAILIDDFSVNITEWAAAGGIALLHTSAEASITALIDALRMSPTYT